VVAITRGGTHAVVQLEPRIDYALIGLSAAELKSRQKQRPPQKPFDESTARENGGDVTKAKFPGYQHIPNWRDANAPFFVFEGNHFLNGYMYKEVAIENQLETENVIPTMGELQRFQKAEAADDDDDDPVSKKSSMAQIIKDVAKSIASAKSHNIPFVRGDTVRVTKGENTGLIGNVVSVDTAQKTVTVSIADVAGQEIVAHKHVSGWPMHGFHTDPTG
jgi:hypothetical protein